MQKKDVVVGIQSNRVVAIDYLKGFSIFTIVLMHLLNTMSAIPSKIQTLASIGGAGVHVFFLCSGIGLYLSYLKRKTNYYDFLRKRFTKIYIPYIIIVFISFLLPWMYTGIDRFIALLSHVFLFKMFVSRFEVSFGMQLWFISTIIQLYLVFLPMCKLKEKMKNNKLFVGTFFVISISWWIFCYCTGVQDVRIWSSFCLQYIWEFALGFIIAEKLLEGKVFKISNYLLAIIAIIGIALQAGMALVSDELKIFNDIPALCGYTALALCFMNISYIEKGFIWLSRISYEFYLVHILVFVTVFHFTDPKGLFFQCLIGIISMIVTIIFSVVYHKFLYSMIFKKITTRSKVIQ